jgi:hypothetical protein
MCLADSSMVQHGAHHAKGTINALVRSGCRVRVYRLCALIFVTALVDVIGSYCSATASQEGLIPTPSPAAEP